MFLYMESSFSFMAAEVCFFSVLRPGQHCFHSGISCADGSDFSCVKHSPIHAVDVNDLCNETFFSRSKTKKESTKRSRRKSRVKAVCLVEKDTGMECTAVSSENKESRNPKNKDSCFFVTIQRFILDTPAVWRCHRPPLSSVPPWGSAFLLPCARWGWKY